MVSAVVLALLLPVVAPNHHSLQAQRARRNSAPRAQALPVQLLAEIAKIEDQRGKHGTPVASLLQYSSHAHPAVRSALARALGRQQDTTFFSALAELTLDKEPTVQRAAIDAIGQAAQGLRGAAQAHRAAASEFLARASTTILEAAGQSAASIGLAARTLGRLPWNDSSSARTAEQQIVALAARRDLWNASGAGAHGILHGLYSLARARRTLGTPAPLALELMSRLGAAPQARALPEIRRLALLGLTAAGSVPGTYLQSAASDPDEQVRRLSVLVPAALTDADTRRGILRRAVRDPSPIVRHEAVRQWRTLISTDGCAELTRAVADGNAHVAIAAIDGLVQCSQDAEVPNLLERTIQQYAATAPNSTANSKWQLHAHALLALARSQPERARTHVRRAALNETIWGVREYSARAAALIGDTTTLSRLAADATPNVQASAVAGLARVVGHSADSAYISALASPHYQVVMAAAAALGGTPHHPRAARALIAALTRLTNERRENTRDARLAVLERLNEVAQSVHASALRPLAADFDSTVARSAATLLSRLVGSTVAATPTLLNPPDDQIAPLLTGQWSARFTMRGDRGQETFVVRLHPAEAPYTVARFVRLARAGYYNGLTFHRVEPGFVIQGGSPSAVEYVGDGPFMRDEVGTRSHTRGTLGISTRGRDTGDAQIFVNLTDNFRLDHDYTVFGEIVSGRAVAELVREADIIQRVEILRR